MANVSVFEALGASTAANAGTAGSAATGSKAAQETADRFLALLVAQMKNQDPLNPMDNAQVTSQMAQINTVAGIDKLNISMQGLGSQLMQQQMLQGASLVGREVLVPGNQLSIENGLGIGAFDLAQDADAVMVRVVTADGATVDQWNLGAVRAGQQFFEWPAGTATNGSGLRFQIEASRGAGNARQVISTQTMMQDRVLAVSATGDGLRLTTEQTGEVPMSSIRTLM